MTFCRSAYLTRTLFVLAVFAAFLTAPSLANAAGGTRYVATTGSDAANDCNSQGSPCATIKYALTQADDGDTVSVGAGTYAEGPLFIAMPNIHLVGAGADQTIITPDPAQMTYTAQNAGFKYAIVTVGGSMGSVEIAHLSLAGPDPAGNHCGTAGGDGNPALLDYGLLVDGATYVNFHDANVTNIREEPLGNCQHDHGVRFRNSALGVIDNVNISGFQKTGLIVSGAGTNVEVKNNTVTGIAQQTTLLQNGMQISGDAVANVHDNTIKDVSCGGAFCGPDPWTQQQEVALMLFGADPASTADHNDISTSDLGIYAQFNAPNASISQNNVHDNQFTGILTDGSFINLYFNTVKNNPIGIFNSTYSGQASQNSARYVSNNIHDNTEGMVYQDDGAEATTDTSAYANRIVGNTNGVVRRAGSTLTYNMDNNWWGCNAGPNNSGCDSASAGITAPKWLVLAIHAPSSWQGGTSVTVDTDARYNNDGDDVYNLLGAIPSTPITFGGTHATPTPASDVTAGGAASFQALLAEQLTTAQVTSTLDNQTVSADIDITGNVPVLNTGPVATGNAQDGFETTHGIWMSISPITYTYQWQLCTTNELNQTTCVDIPGATDSTFQSDQSMNGKQVRACVTATNWVGSVPDACTNQLTVTYTQAPVNTALPTVTISPDGKTATAGAGQWTGTEPLTFTYQWQLCDKDGGNCTDLPDTGDTVALSRDWEGKTLRVTQTATNVAGHTSATSAAKVLRFPPVNAQLPSGEFTLSADGGRLSGAAGAWNGSLPMTFTYQWYLCNAHGKQCKAIKGANRSTVQTKAAWNGKAVRLKVKAKNAAGVATATSKPIRVTSTNSQKCYPTDAKVKVTVDPGQGTITGGAITVNGRTVKRIPAGGNVYTTSVRLSASHNQRTTVRSRFTTDNPQQVVSSTTAYVTCKAKAHHYRPVTG